MKVKAFLISAVYISLLIVTNKIFAQENPISSIKFYPPQPSPGDSLRLDIKILAPGALKSAVEIRHITWTDLNADCKYSEAGEEVEHPLILVTDNQKGIDEKPADNEIRVHIFNVPTNNPPQKHVVIVKYGNYLKSASIIVRPKGESLCDPQKVIEGRSIIKLLNDLHKSVSIKLRNMQEILEGGKTNEVFGGEHGLFVYSLMDSSVEKIVHSDTVLFLSPSWSHDGKKIAVIVKQDSVQKIGWIDLKEKFLYSIMIDSKVKTPFWLPDRQRIIFLKENQLHIIDTESKQIKPLAEKLRIDDILAVSPGSRNTFHVILNAPNKFTNETKEFYLLTFDSKLKQKQLVQLVNNPVWLFSSAISPTGEKFVYSEENTLLIICVVTDEKQRLFDDGHSYYQPAWSPNGDRIVFVSNRR